MDFSAIVMMLLSIILLWGGLVLSIWHLKQHPEQE